MAIRKTKTTKKNPAMETCSRCFGRGYIPEARKSGQGFYARSCAGCGGVGSRPVRAKATKSLAKKNPSTAAEARAEQAWMCATDIRRGDWRAVERTAAHNPTRYNIYVHAIQLRDAGHSDAEVLRSLDNIASAKKNPSASSKLALCHNPPKKHKTVVKRYPSGYAAQCVGCDWESTVYDDTITAHRAGLQHGSKGTKPSSGAKKNPSSGGVKPGDVVMHGPSKASTDRSPLRKALVLEVHGDEVLLGVTPSARLQRLGYTDLLRTTVPMSMIHKVVSRATKSNPSSGAKQRARGTRAKFRGFGDAQHADLLAAQPAIRRSLAKTYPQGSSGRAYFVADAKDWQRMSSAYRQKIGKALPNPARKTRRELELGGTEAVGPHVSIHMEHGTFIIQRHPAHPAGHAAKNARTLTEARRIARTLAAAKAPRSNPSSGAKQRARGIRKYRGGSPAGYNYESEGARHSLLLAGAARARKVGDKSLHRSSLRLAAGYRQALPNPSPTYGRPLTVKDRRAIAAFLKQQPYEGTRVESTGTSLDGMWMGGRGLARWSGGKITFGPTGGPIGQRYQRAVQKAAGIKAPLGNPALRKNATMPDSMRLTAAETAELEKIKDAAKIRHEKARRAAKARGRKDFPDLPYECSWAFEEDFRRKIRSNPASKSRTPKTREKYVSPKRYSAVELTEAQRLDLLSDAEHAEAQAANGPYYPERGITKESLLAYAAECRKGADPASKYEMRAGQWVPKPKFKVGDQVMVFGTSVVGEVSFNAGYDEFLGQYRYKVKDPRNGSRIHYNENSLVRVKAAKAKRNPGMSHEATELELFIQNDSVLYHGQQLAIEKNLRAKIAKGKYDPTLAPTLWGYLVEAGAKKYAKDFASARDWHKMFPVAVRREVAESLARQFEEEEGLRSNSARSNPARKSIGERDICAACDLEIEWHGSPYGWVDRGNNTTCNRPRHPKHRPSPARAGVSRALVSEARSAPALPPSAGRRRSIGERDICAACDLEVEWHGSPYGWVDRGNNTTCNRPRHPKHKPVKAR